MEARMSIISAHLYLYCIFPSLLSYHISTITWYKRKCSERLGFLPHQNSRASLVAKYCIMIMLASTTLICWCVLWIFHLFIIHFFRRRDCSEFFQLILSFTRFPLTSIFTNLVYIMTSNIAFIILIKTLFGYSTTFRRQNFPWTNFFLSGGPEKKKQARENILFLITLTA